MGQVFISENVLILFLKCEVIIGYNSINCVICSFLNYNISQMLPVYSEKPAKNMFNFHLRKDDPPLTIRSNFDGGNISKLQIGLNNTIILTPANDCTGTQYQSHAKGWFHFAVSGFGSGVKQKFIIKRMNNLGAQTKFSDYFKPVYRYKDSDKWERIQQSVTFSKQDETQLHFEFQFQKNSQVFFAYTFPFSYQECEKIICEVKNEAKYNKGIYFNDEILIKSVQGRSIHLITISSNDLKLTNRQSPIDDHLFLNSNNRAFKFTQSKRVVIISARVHPGEAPSSHTMNGILKFLVSKDARAEILRKNFVFKLIPMLNPDGVYHGHYRMDTLNQNLNRFYLQPDPIKQPSSFALKKLGEYFKLQNRLIFFMDLHAHPQRKGNFIYGNSIENNESQVETQLYPKILSLNCVQFDYENSCFSKNHMTLKDRNDDLSKQGCSRVVFHRELGIIYSYTMQCGYTQSNYFNELCPLSNPHRKMDKYKVIQNQLDNVKSTYYIGEKKKYFTVESYQNLGRSILISILDLFQMNQFSRLPNGSLKTNQQIRQFINQNLLKMNKDFKPYEKKTQPIINAKRFERFERHTINQSNLLITKSVPKTIIGMIQRKIVSSKSKILTKNCKDGIRRRTLPKMRGLK